MDDQTDMQQACDSMTPLAVQAPRHASGGEQTDKAASGTSRFRAEREPPRHKPGSGPVFRCGHCMLPMADMESDPALRCPGCDRRNALPGHIWVCCERCHFEQRVRTHQLTAEPCCVNCGQVLVVDDVVLTPLVHRGRPSRSVTRRHRHSHRGHRSGNHDQAILLLAMFAAAVFLSLKLLSQL